MKKKEERRMRFRKTIVAGSVGDKSSQVGLSMSPTPRAGLGHWVNPFNIDFGSRNNPLAVKVTPDPVKKREQNT